MQSKLKLKKDSDSPVVEATKYRSLVGSLRYLIHTRPDLAYAVGYVSRCMEDPHEHLAAVKHILRFVAGPSELGVFYPMKKEGEAELIGYTDSDLAGDLDDQKSTSGIIFFLGRSLLAGSPPNKGLRLNQVVRLNMLQLQLRLAKPYG
jgi:hypothetical protein